MYFKIEDISKTGSFSWIICKNPESVFDKNISKKYGRKVKAKFLDDGHVYEGFVVNSSLEFLDTARSLNMSNYLHEQLSSVCPYNLKGFDTVFRSALKGNNAASSVISDDIFFSKTSMKAIIGPYVAIKVPVEKGDLWDNIFESYNIKATKIFDEKCKVSFMYQFETLQEMSVTEFLQKIYLISFAITSRKGLVRLATEQIEKFVDLCKNWLGESEYRNFIVNNISGNKKNSLCFEKNLVMQEETTASEKEKIEKFIENVENKEASLHELRHNIILEKISPDTKKIIDFGCSTGMLSGKMAMNFSSSKILAIDGNFISIKKAKRFNKKFKNIQFETGNIVYPNIERDWLEPDFLVATEVIEHLYEKDRKAVLDNINFVICPKEIIITVPNIEYNYVWNIPEGKYRHKDHKIEYTEEQFQDEILEPLSKNYELERNYSLVPGELQPTFIVYGKRKDNAKPVNMKKYHKIKQIYDSFYIEQCNYVVRDREINTGLTSPVLSKNGDDIFYLGPTMSPVDYLEGDSLLESPYAAFEYYRNRGVKYLVEEPKHMGSRGYVLAFKDHETANMMGYSHPLVINSRAGWKFFDDDKILDEIYESDFKGKMKNDFIMFDCEILPWSYKAKRLIEKDFLGPGESAYLLRRYAKSDNIENAKDFLETINGFVKDGPIEIYPFHILAKGDCIKKRGQGQFFNIKTAFTSSHMDQIREINFFEGKYIKPTSIKIVNLENKNATKESFDRWVKFCETGGEGFVYKPLDFITHTDNMYILQPAVKVRGKKYLQMVYGIDYLEKDYFSKVTKRSIKKKRLLAVQQQFLGLKILKSFLNGNKEMTRKMIASFIGVENVNYSNIDATL
jgi:trans-aconitate methyltransferase